MQLVGWVGAYAYTVYYIPIYMCARLSPECSIEGLEHHNLGDLISVSYILHGMCSTAQIKLPIVGRANLIYMPTWFDVEGPYSTVSIGTISSSCC